MFHKRGKALSYASLIPQIRPYYTRVRDGGKIDVKTDVCEWLQAFLKYGPKEVSEIRERG